MSEHYNKIQAIDEKISSLQEENKQAVSERNKQIQELEKQKYTEIIKFWEQNKRQLSSDAKLANQLANDVYDEGNKYFRYNPLCPLNKILVEFLAGKANLKRETYEVDGISVYLSIQFYSEDNSKHIDHIGFSIHSTSKRDTSPVTKEAVDIIQKTLDNTLTCSASKETEVSLFPKTEEDASYSMKLTKKSKKIDINKGYGRGFHYRTFDNLEDTLNWLVGNELYDNIYKDKSF